MLPITISSCATLSEAAEERITLKADARVAAQKSAQKGKRDLMGLTKEACL